MPDEIRECPFCGGVNTDVAFDGEWGYGFCLECHARGPACKPGTAVAEAWNHRPITDPIATAHKIALDHLAQLAKESAIRHHLDLLASIDAAAESLRDGYE